MIETSANYDKNSGYKFGIDSPEYKDIAFPNSEVKRNAHSIIYSLGVIMIKIIFDIPNTDSENHIFVKDIDFKFEQHRRYMNLIMSLINSAKHLRGQHSNAEFRESLTDLMTVMRECISFDHTSRPDIPKITAALRNLIRHIKPDSYYLCKGFDSDVYMKTLEENIIVSQNSKMNGAFHPQDKKISLECRDYDNPEDIRSLEISNKDVSSKTYPMEEEKWINAIDKASKSIEYLKIQRSEAENLDKLRLDPVVTGNYHIETLNIAQKLHDRA